ncbi:hypothetical protein E4T95_08245 [Micrococcus yunnanensis]|nr:hypothetical protein E4T95_08245 [Micrococcus yunnanensis]
MGRAPAAGGADDRALRRAQAGVRAQARPGRPPRPLTRRRIGRGRAGASARPLHSCTGHCSRRVLPSPGRARPADRPGFLAWAMPPRPVRRRRDPDESPPGRRPP